MEKTIVFSFIGKARKNNGPGYQKTSYFFQERNKVWEDSFFGNALVNELDDRGVTIDKWVIIGTPTSTWSEIIGVIADKVEFNEELTDIWHQVENEQEKGLSEETLKKWQNLINENMLKIKEINFHLVEPQNYSFYTDILLKELSPEGEYNVILDMTHGFRTMPTVMSFSIMLVQTLRKIENIDIYYGAFDMMDSLGRTPVLKIDFVNKLSKFTQALSIYQNTGYFVQLLKEVDYPEDRGKDLHFKLEMNRRVKKHVEEIINHLDSFTDYRREICLPLKKDLENVIKTKRLHGRMIEKAKKFFEQKQYLKALILLYEGLILCGNDIFNKNKEIKHKDEQLNIRNEIKKYFDKQGLEDYSKDLQTITEVRNSVVHGNDKQQQYLENENKFIQLFNKGIEIYEILSKAIV